MGDSGSAFFPRLPRHLERFHNRLRLLLYLADRRGMFAANAERTARHLGKWAVLQEFWPELAQKLSDQPERMATLERDPSKALPSLRPHLDDVQKLHTFLKHDPKLGDSLAELTSFRRSG